jgi:hypothetical protein
MTALPSDSVRSRLLASSSFHSPFICRSPSSRFPVIYRLSFALVATFRVNSGCRSSVP